MKKPRLHKAQSRVSHHRPAGVDPLCRSLVRHQAETMAQGLPPLLIAAERIASSVAQGVHGRRRSGPGETFWQFRHYQTGDPVRAIDWRRSAKSGTVYVRESEWEAAQNVWLWRDDSPSMAYRSARRLPTKKAYADLLVMALASLLVRSGERIALFGDDDAPGHGRARLARLYTALERSSSAASHDQTPTIEMLANYGSMIGPSIKNARVVLVGDFLAPVETIRQGIVALARHGVAGAVLQILDPAEMSLPFGGRIRFEGPENEGGVTVGHAETVRKPYRAALERHLTEVKDAVHRAGWTYHRCLTDAAPAQALLLLYMALADTGA